MKSITEIRSLGDIRTPISTHARSTPRHKGTTYLEILSLGMEKQRLLAEQAALHKRLGRIELRMSEIDEKMGKLVGKVQVDSQERPVPSADAATLPTPPKVAGIPRKSRTMPLEY